MRRVVFVVLILFLSGQTAYAQPGRTVLDRRDLQHAGVLTLNDIFELTGQWTVSSTDGFTIQHSRNGLAGPGGVHWPVFLNDVPLSLDVWDTRSLNRIPVDISQIDSVVVISEPQLAGGESMEKGGLFIYTQTRDEGLSANAGLWTGNRSGDPGPFVYTDRATPNLERLGPIASASVSYKADRFSIEGGAKQILHYVSDPIQSGRILPLAFGDEMFRHPKIELESFYLRAGHSGERVSNEIQAGLSDADDLLYTGMYGTEIPVNNRWSFLSLKGGIKLSGNGNTEIGYRLSRNSTEAVERDNKENHLLRWDQHVTAGKISMQHDFNNGSVEPGVGFNRYFVKDRIGPGQNLSADLFSIFNRLRLDLAGWLTSRADFMLVKGERDRPALKTFLNFTARPAEKHRMTAGFSYSERLPEEDNSLSFWIGEKEFGGGAFSGYVAPGIQSFMSLLQGHLSWNVRFSNLISVKSKVAVSRYLDEYEPVHLLFSREQRYIETGLFSPRTDLNATELMVPLELAINPSDDLYGTVQYTWNHLLSGPDNLWESAPGHWFHARFNWKPVDSFKIWTKINIRSEREWLSLTLLDGETLRTNYGATDVTYRSVSPARVRWDAGFSKDFWDGRIAFKLQALNLLNQKYREHPLGPMHSFTIFLGAEVSFSGQ